MAIEHTDQRAKRDKDSRRDNRRETFSEEQEKIESMMKEEGKELENMIDRVKRCVGKKLIV